MDLSGSGLCPVVSFQQLHSVDTIKLRGFGPLANYADRATAACWRSSASFCG
jgi:hypothetical protein